MTNYRACVAASALLCSCMIPLMARADAAAGEAIAQRWCANCHVVGTTTTRTTVPQGPPGFPAIAQHLDAGALRAFLSHPHKPMPDLALTRAEIEDLVAYIETFRK